MLFGLARNTSQLSFAGNWRTIIRSTQQQRTNLANSQPISAYAMIATSD